MQAPGCSEAPEAAAGHPAGRERVSGRGERCVGTWGALLLGTNVTWAPVLHGHQCYMGTSVTWAPLLHGHHIDHMHNPSKCCKN